MRVWAFSRAVLLGFIALLGVTSASSCGGNERGIPIVVTIRAPSESLTSARVTPTLNGMAFAAVFPAKPTTPFVLYLPVDSQGRLELAVQGSDSEGCTSQGTTSLDVRPSKGEAIYATIEIDARTYPQCELTLKVTGNGAIETVDKTFRCESVAANSEKECTKSFHRSTQVSLMGQEGGIDSGMDHWLGDCGCASDACALTMNRPKKAHAIFRQRVCRPDGSCEYLQQTDAQSSLGYVFSSNALWHVNEADVLKTWDSVNKTWANIEKLDAPAYAMWGNKAFVWILTKDRKIRSCSSGTRRCQVLLDGAKTSKDPSMLFSIGGDGTNRFWAIDRRFLYRCSEAVCDPPVAIADVNISQAASTPKRMVGLARANPGPIVAGQYSSTCGETCSYFTQRCDQGTGETIESNSCLTGSQIQMRQENGSDPALWVKLGNSVYRINGKSAQYLRKPKMDDCTFFPEMVAEDLNQSRWIVGEKGKISVLSADFASCERRGNATETRTLRAVWHSNKGDAWIVGDQGIALLCPATTGTPCVPKTLDPKILNQKIDLVVVHGDNAGKVWAVSRDGIWTELK